MIKQDVAYVYFEKDTRTPFSLTLFSIQNNPIKCHQVGIHGLMYKVRSENLEERTIPKCHISIKGLLHQRQR